MKMRMGEIYTNREMEDIHLFSGATNCSRVAWMKLYRSRFPDRRNPYYTMFVHLHSRLHVKRRFLGRMNDTDTERLEEAMLAEVNKTI